MLSLYPAIFYREKDNSFSVVFPDLNHLATEGENLTEAMQMAMDCLAGYIYSARQDGEDLPPPTPREKVDVHCEDDEDDDYEDVFVNIIPVDVEEYAAKHFEKAVKKTLTIPEWLDKKAKDLKINFSSILKEKLIEICSGKSSGSMAAVSTLGRGGGLWFFLPIAGGVDVSQSKKSVKKTLTIPKWLNERAIEMNVNFSAALQEGLMSACEEKDK